VVIQPAAMPEFSNLLEGYRRFREGTYLTQKRRWAALAGGQAPPVMVISCCDSRVDPATIFDTSPGEMFVLRNVANLVPPFNASGGRLGASAAIEYAVVELKVRQIVVMGHGACGGIRAALSRKDLGVPGYTFIDAWMSIIDDARVAVQAKAATDASLDAQHALELEAIRVSLGNLRSFPFIRAAEAAGQLKLRGAYFAIADGELHLLDEQTGAFGRVP
jgi:carbonic anhydrase